jgi:hypothetical protein
MNFHQDNHKADSITQTNYCGLRTVDRGLILKQTTVICGLSTVD